MHPRNVHRGRRAVGAEGLLRMDNAKECISIIVWIVRQITLDTRGIRLWQPLPIWLLKDGIQLRHKAPIQNTHGEGRQVKSVPSPKEVAV